MLNSRGLCLQGIQQALDLFPALSLLYLPHGEKQGGGVEKTVQEKSVSLVLLFQSFKFNSGEI